MARKLRINVVSSSRDRRFLVLAERDWTMATFKQCAEDVFNRLYPDEPKLQISRLQNEFHFDIPLCYWVDDVLVDAGLVFVVEEEISLVKSLSRVPSLESKSKTGHANKELCKNNSPRKRTNPVKKSSRSVKIQTHLPGRAADCTSSTTRVSSTTSPTLTDQASSMMPQIVEKISEDSEVDIESVDDSIIIEDTSHTTGGKRKVIGKKASQQVLRKARKLKTRTLNKKDIRC